jgi:hypothetical protein
MVHGRSSRYVFLFLLLVLMSICSVPMLAQRITGDIAGEVTDATGAVLPNVTVTAVNTGANYSRSAVTSDTGAFRIPELPIGTYKVTASAEGFKSAVQTTNVQAGAVNPASFKLTIGQRTETPDMGLVRAFLMGKGQSHHQNGRQLPARVHQQPAQ